MHSFPSCCFFLTHPYPLPSGMGACVVLLLSSLTKLLSRTAEGGGSIVIVHVCFSGFEKIAAKVLNISQTLHEFAKLFRSVADEMTS